MDGVLGNVSTEVAPAAAAPKPETVSQGKTTVKAKDLRRGQIIRFEFGIPGNWVTLLIERIEPFEKMIILIGENNGFQRDYSFRPEDEVEVIRNE